MPTKKFPEPEVVRRLYWDESLTTREVSERLSVSENGVRTFMRRHGIPMRTKSEALKLANRKGLVQKRPKTQSPLKDILRCRSCGWSWLRQGDRGEELCPSCGKRVNARKRPAPPDAVSKLRDWTKNNPERNRERRRNLAKRQRYTILKLIGKGDVACSTCGCNRPELLEINHINGGGGQEIKEVGSQNFYRDIASFRRNTDDLDLRCKVCNALHALELKYGPLPYVIEFRREVWSDDGEDVNGGL